MGMNAEQLYLQEIIRATLKRLEEIQFSKEQLEALKDELAEAGIGKEEFQQKMIIGTINLGSLVEIFCNMVSDYGKLSENELSNAELFTAITVMANGMSHLLGNVYGHKGFVPLDKRHDANNQPNSTFILASGDCCQDANKAVMLHGDKDEIAYLLYKAISQDEDVKRKVDMLKLMKIFEDSTEIPENIRFGKEEKAILFQIGSNSEEGFLGISNVVSKFVNDVFEMHNCLRKNFIDPIREALDKATDAKENGMDFKKAKEEEALDSSRDRVTMRSAYIPKTVQ